MPLPDLIEIVPLAAPVKAEITVPGSKSITNRALILAALAKGRTTLRGALWSEDTQVMVEALKTLGFALDVQPDAEESSNRTITVTGLGGKVPHGGTDTLPLDLFVGNAGTAARFLAALVCLGRGVYRLSGVPRMHERPQAALFSALRQLGYRVDTPNDRLPAMIYARSALSRVCEVSIGESSQFASALLLCAPAGKWSVFVRGENAEESPYVAMTSKLRAVFPEAGGSFQIEPDASSGSYFWAAGWLAPVRALALDGNPETHWSASGKGTVRRFAESDFVGVTVNSWPATDWQIDANFPRRIARRKLAHRFVRLPLPHSLSRQYDLGDSIMTAIVLAPFTPELVKFTDLGRLRLQECERVVALRTELTKCGARVEEAGDTLTVYPSQLHGAAIETYHDHRMAMCFATLGLKVPGMRIKNPACVNKTFPSFFQKLAAAPPHGLGAMIRDAATGRLLAGDDLLPG